MLSYLTYKFIQSILLNFCVLLLCKLNYLSDFRGGLSINTFPFIAHHTKEFIRNKDLRSTMSAVVELQETDEGDNGEVLKMGLCLNIIYNVYYIYLYFLVSIWDLLLMDDRPAVQKAVMHPSIHLGMKHPATKRLGP